MGPGQKPAQKPAQVTAGHHLFEPLLSRISGPRVQVAVDRREDPILERAEIEVAALEIDGRGPQPGGQVGPGSQDSSGEGPAVAEIPQDQGSHRVVQQDVDLHSLQAGLPAGPGQFRHRIPSHQVGQVPLLGPFQEDAPVRRLHARGEGEGEPHPEAGGGDTLPFQGLGDAGGEESKEVPGMSLAIRRPPLEPGRNGKDPDSRAAGKSLIRVDQEHDDPEVGAAHVQTHIGSRMKTGGSGNEGPDHGQGTGAVRRQSQCHLMLEFVDDGTGRRRW